MPERTAAHWSIDELDEFCLPDDPSDIELADEAYFRTLEDAKEGEDFEF